MFLIWIFLALGAVAHAPLLWKQALHLWGAEHFQFFPIALIAIVVVVQSRRHQIFELVSKPISIVLWLAMLSSLAVLFFAIVADSQMIGWLGFLFFLLVVQYGWFGHVGVWRCLPILVLFLLIKPVPKALDLPLTVSLQQLASTIASNLLDLFGVLHFKQGVVLTLGRQTFLAEDACSGIRSLFSSVFAIVCWGMLYKYPWWRHPMNILQTVFWVIALNAVRIAVVILVEEWSDYSIATGAAHDAAGLVAFFVIFGFVLSTNCLLISMFPGPDDESEPYPHSTQSKPLASVMYRPSVLQNACWTIGSILLAFFAVVAIRPKLNLDDPANLIAMQKPERNEFPNELLGWKVTEFDHIQRGKNDIQGVDSFVWTLTKDTKTVRLSIDSSFDDFHDLEWCYEGTGWFVTQTRSYGVHVAPRGSQEELTSEYCSLDVWRKTGEKGHVYFGAVDRTGRTVIPPTVLPLTMKNFMARASQRIAYALGGLIGPTQKYVDRDDFEVPVSTIQIIYMPNADVSEAELSEIKELYLQARVILRQIPRFRRT